MRQAACRGVAGQQENNPFFPERGQNTVQAKRFCAGCPVRDECKEYSQRLDLKWGVWGGETRGRSA